MHISSLLYSEDYATQAENKLAKIGNIGRESRGLEGSWGSHI